MEYGESYESGYTPSLESSAESVDVSADTSIDSSMDVSSEGIEESAESVDTDFDTEDMTAESGTEISEGDFESNNEGTEDIHGLGGSGLPGPGAALAPSGDAGVGLHLDEHPAGRAENRGDFGDLHIATSLISW